MKTLCFKFQQNRAINEEFYFWGGKILSGGPMGSRVARFKKNRKILIQNGGLNPQPKFQHSRIRKCLQIGDFWEGFRPPKGGWTTQFQESEKKTYRMVVETYSQDFSTLAQLECV